MGTDQLDENLAVGTLILGNTTLSGDLGDKVLSGIETAVLNGKVGANIDQGVNFFNASLATIPVTMIGGKGADTMIGGQAGDFLNGNGDNDSLDGGLGNDSIQGGAGKDFLIGGDGNDTLEGQGANDTLRGESGDDNLDGGAGFCVCNDKPCKGDVFPQHRGACPAGDYSHLRPSNMNTITVCHRLIPFKL